MELTPKVFRDVQFREKLRGGYHPEDVDEFLEQAALAVEAMQAQLRQALDRAQRAEMAAGEASSTDETLRKVLLLAQRTADQAIGEARNDADRIVAEARAKSAAMLVDAEDRSRKAYEDSVSESRRNLARAEEARRQAEEEVEALRGWVDQHKGHLLSVLREAEALVERAGFLSEPPTVTPSGVASDHDAGHFARAGLEESGESGEGTSEAGTAAPLSEDATAEWDAQHQNGFGGDEAAGQPAPQQAGAIPDGGAFGSAYSAYGQAPGNGVAASAAGQGEATMAFDERALDSFFSDQDLGESRGLGRFRRRQ
ncbi:MAG TPA: DivIVA domain-containing protein [Acidimicrobiales bacterium]|nr:DivIVA domain-containing protein [Acidimicrobiales bacterium]